MAASLEGMFAFRTDRDLVDKLRRDLARLHENPDNSDAAFDFFVTAEHIPEWMSPPEPKLRVIEPILQVVSHIASGAKHFRVSDKRHQSVLWSGRRGGFFGGCYFAARYFPSRYFSGQSLVVDLDGEAAINFGPSISVVGLAEKVMHYWEMKIAEQ